MEENLFLASSAVAKAIKDNISSSLYKSKYLDEVSFGTIEPPLSEELEILLNSLAKNSKTASRLPTIRVSHSVSVDFSSNPAGGTVLSNSFKNEMTITDIFNGSEIPYSGSNYIVRLKMQVIIITREFSSSIKLQTLTHKALKSLPRPITYPITMMNRTTNDTLFYCEDCGEITIIGEIENDTQHDREKGIFVSYLTFDVDANIFSLEEIAKYAGAEDDEVDNYCLKQSLLLEGSRGMC